MYSYVFAGVVAASALAVGAATTADDKGSATRSLDGAWTVVCYEKDGRPQAEAAGMTVKAEGGTITCTGKDGQPAMTLKVAFGANGTVQVTEGAGDAATPATAARGGVYVLAQDYLAISVNGEAAAAGAEAKQPAGGPQGESRCSVILKRDGARRGEQK